MNRLAKFNIGDIVIHKQQGYRAIIVDIDPLFQASGRYNPQAVTRKFACKNPWYRLLVDNSSQMTYVEEPFLTLETKSEALLPVDNPLLEDYQKRIIH